MIPIFFVFQNTVDLKEAVVAGAGNKPLPKGLANGTALLLGMGAFGVSAMADVISEFPHGKGQVFLGEKVKAGKVQHGKAGGVGYVAAFCAGHTEKLYRARGVLAALDLAADLTRLQLQSREKRVEQRGFAHARSACKGGNAALAVGLDVFAQRVHTVAVLAAGTKGVKARARVKRAQFFCVIGVCVVFGHHDDGGDVMVLQDADQLVHARIEPKEYNCCSRKSKR